MPQDPMLYAHLESFVEIARRGNVSRAAEALYLTQPAVTARLKSLESDLGVELFVRTGRGVKLTDAGRAFLPYAERALQAVAEGRQVLSELERGIVGHVAIGASPAVSTYALPSILKRFQETHPDVQVAVRTGHSEEVAELVKRDDVAVGLSRALSDPDLEWFTLYEDELVLVVHPEHRFVADVGTAELADEQFVLFDRASSYHELTSALFLEAGIVPRSVMELDNIDSAKKMVEQGLGVAFLPHVAVAGEVRGGRLRIVPIADRQPPRRPIVAVRRRHAGPPTGATAAFLWLLKRMRSELQEAASATA
jgi:DNA-binding transcriptional LysR family regulator